MRCSPAMRWVNSDASVLVVQVSQTLVSTGTRAIYLAPVDALHGDIGIVQPNDYLVMLSKSGARSPESGRRDNSRHSDCLFLERFCRCRIIRGVLTWLAAGAS